LPTRRLISRADGLNLKRVERVVRAGRRMTKGSVR
jgi:hypothetical protein